MQTIKYVLLLTALLHAGTYTHAQEIGIFMPAKSVELAKACGVAALLCAASYGFCAYRTKKDNGKLEKISTDFANGGEEKMKKNKIDPTTETKSLHEIYEFLKPHSFRATCCFSVIGATLYGAAKLMGHYR